MTFLWIVLAGSLALVAVATTVRAWLGTWARNGKSGSEYLYMALSPLFFAELLARFAGGVAGVLLVVLLDEPRARTVAGVLGGVLVLLCIPVVTGLLRHRKSLATADRVLGQDEMLELIRSRAITSFVKEADGSLRFVYAERDDDLFRPTNADPEGYPAYVAAADEVRRGHGHTIAYRSRADAPVGPRWVTVEEATALLDAAEIKTFTYRELPEHRQVPESGTPTGIKLLDHGWVRHLVVDPAMEATMIPIARAAQRVHGRPQFSSNGWYEQPGRDQPPSSGRTSP